MIASPDHHIRTRVRESFISRFGMDPDFIICAPGRINLIGEHTDYNDGFVLPAAIGFGIWLAFGRSASSHHAWYAHDMDDAISLPCDAPGPMKGWAGYFQGACNVLSQEMPSGAGVNCVFSSDLPVGAGLSSSSALTCGFLLGLNALYALPHDPAALALLAHRVEREYIGLQGGIMDQHACLLSREGQFLHLDCRDRSYNYVPFRSDDRVHLFLINTRVQHHLTETDYNTRAAECREAFDLLNKHVGIQSIRDIMDLDSAVLSKVLPPLLQQRLGFVRQENLRVENAVKAMDAQDWTQLGQLLSESHAGLRDAYAVSCPELDFLVDTVSRESFILGARMMGGGFGGCTINLSTQTPDARFVEDITKRYSNMYGLEPEFIPVRPGPGAAVFLPSH